MIGDPSGTAQRFKDSAQFRCDRSPLTECAACSQEIASRLDDHSGSLFCSSGWASGLACLRPWYRWRRGGVLLALPHAARQVDAVELDPNVPELLRGEFRDFAGGLYDRSEVRVHRARHALLCSRRTGPGTSSISRWATPL